MPGAVSNPLAEVPACAVAAATAPTFPRPRGRAPPGCTWDVQRGGWWRADGSAWKQVRNEKRLQAREARRVEKAPEKAAEQAHRESFATYWAEDRAKCKEQRESLKRDKEERLKLKSEARQAREAETEARKARVQEVIFDGETVYCAKHLYQISTGDVHGEMCGACVDLGWRDVRHAPPPAPERSPTHQPQANQDPCPYRCIFFEDGRFERSTYFDGCCTASFVCRAEDKTNPLKSKVFDRQDPRRFRKDLRLPKYHV